jgi:anti-anti-sigma factor
MTIVTRYYGGVAVITVAGVLDWKAMPTLSAAVETVLVAGRRGLLLNITAVHRIDVTGLSLLVGIAGVVRHAGADLKIIGLSDAIDPLVAVKILLLADVMQSETAARQSFSTNSRDQRSITDRTAA